MNNVFHYFIKFVYNRSVSSTNFNTFEMIYGFNPLTHKNLIPLIIDEKASLDDIKKAKWKRNFMNILGSKLKRKITNMHPTLT